MRMSFHVNKACTCYIWCDVNVLVVARVAYTGINKYPSSVVFNTQ